MKQTKTKIPLVRISDLGTRERHTKDEMEIGGENRGILVAKVRFPLRIDEIHSRGIMNDMHCNAAVQIITLRTIALAEMDAKPSRIYDSKEEGIHIRDIPEDEEITAEMQYFYTIGKLTRNQEAIVKYICFLGMDEKATASRLGIPQKEIKDYVQNAFDKLSDALWKMRDELFDKEK